MEATMEERTVSFVDRVLGRDKSPAGPPVPAEFRTLIDELTVIGAKEGFLSFKPGGRFNQQCRHIRAREIGMRLNMQGGSGLMRKVYDRVDCPNARQLAAAWDEIGDWTV
jgi:hypothetical protein